MGERKRSIKILSSILMSTIILSIGTAYKQIYNTKKENITIQKQSKLEQDNIGDIEPQDEINKGMDITKEKVAYITIDDGPSKYTNQILDILNDNNVKATFFMLNDNMKLHKDEVKRMVNEGHGVGFHGVSHDVKKLYKTDNSTLDEFNTCNETLYTITNKTSNIIRLPYGSKPYTPEANYNSLVKNNYLVWDWTLDTLDWKSTTDQIVSNILYYGREKEELVVLMHEKEQTVQALNDTIKILKNRGYKILPITESISPKNFWLGNTNE